MDEVDAQFNFQVHGQAAATAYLERHSFYVDLASVVKRIIEESLKRRGIKVHSVQARAKDPASFARKAVQPSDVDPQRPKYPKPMEGITDLAAVRVIAYFPGILVSICDLVEHEFDVIEQADKGAALLEDERFGYRSIHYLVRISASRSRLPEYAQFAQAVTEIQVRTILQHAWAEIEHDIQYKSASVIPSEIRRRFMALAGMLEIGDREFQAIQDADKQLTEEARSNVAGDRLERVEIAPDALKAFLDKRIGTDGRISEFSYEWTTRLLKDLGFVNFEQVDRCIKGYSDDLLSRLASGGRQGQTTRFEFMLLAGMGDRLLEQHRYANEPWFRKEQERILGIFREAGVDVRSYDPLADHPAARLENMPYPNRNINGEAPVGNTRATL